MKSKKILLVSLLAILLFALCACSSVDMTGTWVCSDLGEGNEMTYVFTKDGNYSFTNGENTVEGTYAYKSGHLYLDDEDMYDSLRVKDDTLVMYVAYGDTVVNLSFIRK